MTFLGAQVRTLVVCGWILTGPDPTVQNFVLILVVIVAFISIATARGRLTLVFTNLTITTLAITGLDLHFYDCDVGFGDLVLLQLVLGGGALSGLRRRVPLALVRFHVVVVSPATGVTGDPPPGGQSQHSLSVDPDLPSHPSV